MSFDLHSLVELYRLSNYASVILVTHVVYDYFITFSKEVEYVWCRPWTWISTLFVLIRYLGLFQAIFYGLVETIDFPYSVTMYGSKFLLLDHIANDWIDYLLLIFNAAVDLVMIMRIYAMWGRSKIILGLLLCIYVPETVIAFVFASIFDNPNTHMSVKTIQILGDPLCNISYNLPSPLWTYLMPTFAISTALLILPTIGTLKQSVDMYRATKTWQPNRYMKLFVRDGILYFIVRCLYDIQWAIGYAIQDQSDALPFTNSLSLMLLFSMLPRFIINVRELYDSGSRPFRQGIDTGFGAHSHMVTCETTTVPTMVFADSFTQSGGQVVDGHGDDMEMLASKVVRSGSGACRI